MEMIHSRSYTYIIKNIYSNPADVLDKIVTDQKILDRAKSVTESYDDFINTAQVWGTTGMCFLSIHPTFKSNQSLITVTPSNPYSSTLR